MSRLEDSPDFDRELLAAVRALFEANPRDYPAAESRSTAASGIGRPWSNFRDLQGKKRKAILAFARGGDRFHERPIARAMAIRSTLQARRLPPAAVRLQRSAAKSYIYFACALGNFAVEFAFSKIVKAPLKEAAPDAFAEVAQNRRRHLLLHACCRSLSFSQGFLAPAARVPRASNLPLGMRGGSACF
jgi:hypothetical protein